MAVATVEEYFQLEENDPDTRYEYIDGHVYAMAGGTANHDTIKSNMQRILWNLLLRCFENNAEIVLNSLGVRFPLADAYIDVEFEDAAKDF